MQSHVYFDWGEMYWDLFVQMFRTALLDLVQHTLVVAWIISCKTFFHDISLAIGVKAKILHNGIVVMKDLSVERTILIGIKMSMFYFPLSYAVDHVALSLLWWELKFFMEHARQPDT